VARLLEREDAPDTDATQVLPRTERARARRQPRRSPGLLPVAVIAGLVFLLAALAAAFVTRGDGDESGGTPTTPAVIAPPADGATPAEDARNLAKWLRENAR
jgi:hypothetical protein